MPSHRRPAQAGLAQPARLTILSAVAVTAAAALAAVPAQARPAEPPTDSTTAKAAVDRLYQQAEQSTEKYNAAQERSDGLRLRVAQLQDRAARGQQQVNRTRSVLGTIAAAQYRTGGIDPTIVLLLSSDPDAYLERAAALDRLTGRQAVQLHRLQGAQRALGQERAEATRMLDRLESARADVARHKKDVEQKLTSARRLLNSLPADQRAAYGRAPSAADRSVRLPVLPDLGAASSRASAAVAAVRSAIGSPYVWGASGPGSFDCSGLMQWAYARAGISLPRTSQEQRNAGRHVPLSQARPGDLVIYRSNASHVGMYIGGGRVVHAPHPGAAVRTDPVAMMPISSITRP